MPPSRPSLVIVTDRRLVTPAALRTRLTAMLDALPAGAAVVQVREKDLDGRALFALVTDVVAIARPRGYRVLVNDRLDVALAAGADGVHLPESGLDVRDARRIAALAGHPQILVGISRHDPGSSARGAHDGADLVVLGPIWSTPSKVGYGAPLGEPALTDARSRMPASAILVAIGGIDSAERADEARRAGADAVAAIRALWTADDSGAAARALAGLP